MKSLFHSLATEQWPPQDRVAWEAACRPSLRFTRGGAAGHLKSVTRTSMVRAYGYLLDHCHRSKTLQSDLPATGHVTPERIDSFLVELRGRVASVTRYTYLERTYRMASALAPKSDWSWLNDIVLQLKDEIRPRSKASRIIPADRLFKLGRDLMQRAQDLQSTTDLQRARHYRNGLLIALLSLCPIRLKNLASLTVGRQLQLIDGAWWIILAGSETKTGRPDERPLPEVLTPYIDKWLRTWRPLFLDPGDALWASIKGGGLAYTYVGTIITETTRRELGIAINPHLFRDCAVFTIAHEAGDEMGVASALLQHTDPRVTNLHYNRGSSVMAVQQFHKMLEAVKEED